MRFTNWSHAGFQTGKGEVVFARRFWTGQLVNRLALFSEAVNFRAARIAEVEDTGDFVIRFADGVILRLAENFKAQSRLSCK